MNRQELYKQGKFFIRKRKVEPRGKMALVEPTMWAIYISQEFGSWKLAAKFELEEDCDFEIEQFLSDDRWILE